MPAKDELPATLRRSARSAQETWSKAHDSAVDTYGEGKRAHRSAFAALKRSFYQVGDHWEAKKRRRVSDRQPARNARRAAAVSGVAAEQSKHNLYETARRLKIHGRSSMRKDELIQAIHQANAKRTREASRSGH